MRRSTMRWTAAAVTVAVLLWTADATVRVLLSSDGTFLGQLLTPSAGTLVFRATLVSLGVIAVLSLRGMRQLEVRAATRRSQNGGGCASCTITRRTRSCCSIANCGSCS